jgi:formylglycine-generating enzyme required for sulfatase activity
LILLARNLNVPVPSSAIGPRTANATAVETAAPAAAKIASAKAAAPAALPAAAPVAAPRAPAAGGAAGRAPVAATPAAAVAQPPAATEAARASNAAPDPCANAKRRRCRDDIAPGRSGPDLIVLPPGHFKMGSALTAEEQPVHEVAVLRPFAMTRFEVTVAQWRAFCEATGRGGCGGGGDELPVVNVTWKDANDYAKWLSDQTGRHYRLPSEAEWEYAARADTAGEPGHELPSLNPNTDARYAAPGGPQPAGPTAVDDPTFRANGFGLIHLLGNVREWVQDPWAPDYQHAAADAAPREGGGSVRIVRGGSFRDGPERVRPAAREHLEATAKDAQTGFRLVREMRGP